MLDNRHGRILGQLRPANTTAAAIYTPAVHFRAEITKIVACNTSTSLTSFRIFHDQNGTTFDETTSLFWNTPLAVGETISITEDYWMDGRDTGSFGVRSADANAITFTVYGSQERIK